VYTIAAPLSRGVAADRLGGPWVDHDVIRVAPVQQAKVIALEDAAGVIVPRSAGIVCREVQGRGNFVIGPEEVLARRRGELRRFQKNTYPGERPVG
jgi:hypothetical protein